MKESDLKDFLSATGNVEPEDFFSLVTVMPDKGIRITAYLEDETGERILVKQIAKQVVEYMLKHLTSQESTPVNSQLFPLIGAYMTSVIPRIAPFEATEFMFTAGVLRETLITFGLGVALLMQYIKQHNLTIVTETEKLTDREIEEYFKRSTEAEQKLARALQGNLGDTNGNGSGGIN